MKNFWKVLGVAALAVGLTPYKVEKDEERGEKRYQALLWQATVSPGEGEEKKVDVNLGFKSPADKEAHLFSDELSVEYTVPNAEAAPASEDTGSEAAEAESPVEEKIEGGEAREEAAGGEAGSGECGGPVHP